MPDETPQNENLKELREQAAEGARLRAERDQIARENAMLKAGVDLDSPLGKMFGKAYDGELDTDAIKAAATEVGAVRSATPPPQEDEPVHDETQTQARMDLASNSGTPHSQEGENPYRAAMKAYDEARADGTPQDTAVAAAYSKIIEAAKNGDKRVLL